MTDSPPNMNPATVSSVSIPISGRRMTLSRARMPASAAGLAPAATAAACASASSSAPGSTPPVGLPGRPGGSVNRTMAMTPNVTALIANAMVRSVVAMMMPASAGPTMNDSSPRVANRLFAGPSSRSSRTRLGR